MENYSEGLATGMALSQDNRYPYPYMNNGGGFGFGGEWGGLIGLLIVASLFGGNGWGFGGNRGGNCATQADLAAGFNNSAVLSSLNDIKLGQSSMQNFINQGFAGLNSVVNAGFAGVDNAVCTLGYNMQSGFNGLSHQLSDCCCTTQRAIDSVKYENAKNTCDIIRAGQDNTRAILDYLTTEKISSLQAENSGLKAQISNDRQSQYIVSQLKEPCAVPAYLTCDPRVPFNYSHYFNNTGCGCGV